MAQAKPPAKKTKELSYFEATGRRKSAVAQVRLYLTGKDNAITLKGKKIEKGTVLINEKPLEELFSSEHEKKKLLLPLELTQSLDRFAVTVVVNGGGRNGQLEAIVHGIARAMTLVDKDEYRTSLKQEGLLKRDPRTRQRRMVGKGGKARRAKQSPKR